MTQYVLEVTRWLDVGNFTNFFRDLADKLEHNKQVRETIKELNKLNDRELNDIGISRGDSWAVANNDSSIKRVADARETARANANLTGWV